MLKDFPFVQIKLIKKVFAFLFIYFTAKSLNNIDRDAEEEASIIIKKLRKIIW